MARASGAHHKAPDSWIVVSARSVRSQGSRRNCRGRPAFPSNRVSRLACKGAIGSAPADDDTAVRSSPSHGHLDSRLLEVDLSRHPVTGRRPAAQLRREGLAADVRGAFVDHRGGPCCSAIADGVNGCAVHLADRDVRGGGRAKRSRGGGFGRLSEVGSGKEQGTEEEASHLVGQEPHLHGASSQVLGQGHDVPIEEQRRDPDAQ
jgi:hypothetical protein